MYQQVEHVVAFQMHEMNLCLTPKICIFEKQPKTKDQRKSPLGDCIVLLTRDQFVLTTPTSPNYQLHSYHTVHVVFGIKSSLIQF